MSTTERRKEGREVDGQLVRPGEISLIHDGTLLVSVVSSGVAVCLWENSSHLAAMAHFVEPRTSDKSQATARYGNVAILRMLAMVEEHSGYALEAQIFGGAHRPGEDYENSRSKSNVEIARRILSSRGIPIVSEDISGIKGRKIMFDTKTGHVAVIRVHQLREADWEV